MFLVFACTVDFVAMLDSKFPNTITNVIRTCGKLEFPLSTLSGYAFPAPVASSTAPTAHLPPLFPLSSLCTLCGYPHLSSVVSASTSSSAVAAVGRLTSSVIHTNAQGHKLRVCYSC